MAEQDSQLSRTVKHSAIYAIGTFLRRMTGIIMLPIYTRFLTPADYGAVELLTMVVEAAGLLAGTRVSEAMFRYYILEEDEQQKRAIVSTALLMVFIASSIGAILLCIEAGHIAKIIFGEVAYVYALQIYAFTLVTSVLSTVGLSYIRARQKPVLFLSIDIVYLVLQVMLNILFVVILNLHVIGIVYSTFAAGVVLSTGIFIYVIKETGIHFSRAITVKLLRFMTPLVMASLAGLYVAYADKYFLRYFVGLSEVGIYALAAKVGAVLSAVYAAFNKSWQVDRFEIVKKENAKAIYGQVFRFFSAGLILLAAGLALFSGDLFRIMTTPAFYPASRVVPILLFGLTVRIFTEFCQFGAEYRERTGIIAQSSWLKAIVATLGYITLIDYFGVYGAATAHALSLIVGFIWIYGRSTKLYDMGLQWSPVALMYSAAFGCVLIGLALPQGEPAYFAVRIVLFLALLLAVYLMPIWHGHERTMVKQSVTRLSRRAIVKLSKIHSVARL